MSLIIFIIILSILVFVHEAGHFLAAKAFGIRVDEFGLGYPPRAKKLFRWKNTDFTLNWLPFGGFVKIFGEDADEESLHAKDSFVNKNRGAQALVLVAGVFGNFLLAWVLLSLGFMMGMPSPVDIGLPVENPHTAITQVLKNSPADKAELKSGDEVLLITRNGVTAGNTPEEASNFISASEEPLQVTVKRGDQIFTKTLTPESGLVPDKSIVGIGLSTVGIVKLGFLEAFKEGMKVTVELTVLTAKAFIGFLRDIFIGKPNFEGVSGPVGIVGMVGDVSALGFVYILSFAAIISINLSIINLFPFPALDGGRLLFVIIETITRRRMPARAVQLVNTAGFALLILLMVIITVRDLRHLL